jgi:hypothetical protein
MLMKLSVSLLVAVFSVFAEGDSTSVDSLKKVIEPTTVKNEKADSIKINKEVPVKSDTVEDSTKSKESVELVADSSEKSSDSAKVAVDSLANSSDSVTSNDTTLLDSADVTTPDSLVVDSTKIEIDTNRYLLKIVTVPDSVAVTLDGKAFGTTPIKSNNVTVGEHTLILKKSGFYGKKLSVDVLADSSTIVETTLRAPSYLTIITEPDSSIILIDRKKVGNSPLTTSPLKPATYSIMIMKSDFIKIDTTIIVSSGQNDTLSFKLKKKVSDSATLNLDTTQVKSDSTKVDDEIADEDEEKKKKKLALIIGAALFALFASLIVVKELSDD